MSGAAELPPEPPKPPMPATEPAEVNEPVKGTEPKAKREATGPTNTTEAKKEPDSEEELHHNLPIDRQVAGNSIFNGKMMVGTMNIGSTRDEESSVLAWLEHCVSFSDPSGSADFVAVITVETAIVDAIGAVRHGTSGVKDLLEPALRRAVVDAGESGKTVTDSNRQAALTSMRRIARTQIRELEGQKVKGLPLWLSATVLSTTVDFDDKTRRHYDQLVELAQQGQLIDATSENDQRRTEGEITVRKLWRENLIPHLSNPSQRVFEQVMENPTNENITIAVRQADERELALLQEVINAFQIAAKEGFVEKDDPTIQALAGFVGRLPQIISGGEPVPEHNTIDADALPRREEQVDDRDFSN